MRGSSGGSSGGGASGAGGGPGALLSPEDYYNLLIERMVRLLRQQRALDTWVASSSLGQLDSWISRKRRAGAVLMARFRMQRAMNTWVSAFTLRQLDGWIGRRRSTGVWLARGCTRLMAHSADRRMVDAARVWAAARARIRALTKWLRCATRAKADRRAGPTPALVN